MAATAFLYSDGSFVFTDSDVADSSKTLVASYTGWDTEVYYGWNENGSKYPPWYDDGNYINIISVSFEGNIAPVGTANWFFYCRNMTSFDGTNLDTSNVTDMNGMFYYCSNLPSLDLSSFDTSNVTDMNGMFMLSDDLTTIYVSDLWSTAAVITSMNMFNGCSSLSGDIAYSSNYKDKTYATYDGGYLTYKVYPPIVHGQFIVEGETLSELARGIRALNKNYTKLTTDEMIIGLNDAKTAVDNALTALIEKEVEVPDGAGVGKLADLIAAIEAGGGCVGDYRLNTGTFTPSEDIVSATTVDIGVKLSGDVPGTGKNIIAFWVEYTLRSSGTKNAGCWLWSCVIDNIYSSTNTSSKSPIGVYLNSSTSIARETATGKCIGYSNGVLSIPCTTAKKLEAGVQYRWITLDRAWS